MNLLEMASASALIKTELAPLAEKLGQGAQYTFELFVRQVYVNALIGLLWMIPGVILLYLARKLTKVQVRQGEYMDMVSPNTARWIGVVVSLILGILLVVLPIGDLIQALVNPQYKAIELIISTIKGQ